MAKILIRHLSGLNEIVEAGKDVENCPGVRKFSDFIDNLEIPLPELSKALKLPLRSLKTLDHEGYLEGDAQNNILAYLQAKRETVEFKTPLEQYMECQHSLTEER